MAATKSKAATAEGEEDPSAVVPIQPPLTAESSTGPDRSERKASCRTLVLHYAMQLALRDGVQFTAEWRDVIPFDRLIASGAVIRAGQLFRGLHDFAHDFSSPTGKGVA